MSLKMFTIGTDMAKKFVIMTHSLYFLVFPPSKVDLLSKVDLHPQKSTSAAKVDLRPPKSTSALPSRPPPQKSTSAPQSRPPPSKVDFRSQKSILCGTYRFTELTR